MLKRAAIMAVFLLMLVVLMPNSSVYSQSSAFVGVGDPRWCLISSDASWYKGGEGRWVQFNVGLSNLGDVLAVYAPPETGYPFIVVRNGSSVNLVIWVFGSSYYATEDRYEYSIGLNVIYSIENVTNDMSFILTNGSIDSNAYSIFCVPTSTGLVIAGYEGYGDIDVLSVGSTSFSRCLISSIVGIVAEEHVVAQDVSGLVYYFLVSYVSGEVVQTAKVFDVGVYYPIWSFSYDFQGHIYVVMAPEVTDRLYVIDVINNSVFVVDLPFNVTMVWSPTLFYVSNGFAFRTMNGVYVVYKGRLYRVGSNSMGNVYYDGNRVVVQVWNGSSWISAEIPSLDVYGVVVGNDIVLQHVGLVTITSGSVSTLSVSANLTAISGRINAGSQGISSWLYADPIALDMYIDFPVYTVTETVTVTETYPMNVTQTVTETVTTTVMYPYYITETTTETVTNVTTLTPPVGAMNLFALIAFALVLGSIAFAVLRR